jgi:hypothetical protein
MKRLIFLGLILSLYTFGQKTSALTDIVTVTDSTMLKSEWGFWQSTKRSTALEWWTYMAGKISNVSVTTLPDYMIGIKNGAPALVATSNQFIIGTVFNDTVYCNVLNRYYAEDTIKASITVKIKTTGKIQGAIEQIVMVGDGSHTVSFANCTIPSDSYLTIDNTLNKVNWVTFQWDGKRVVVTIRPR